MSIPRGDCDCCGRLVDRLHEVEESYWVCYTCQGAAHRCPLDESLGSLFYDDDVRMYASQYAARTIQEGK